MPPSITILALGLAAAFGLTWVAMSSLAPIARSLGLVDQPGGRKTHEQATPLIGGFAIAIGVGAPVLLSFQASPEIIGLCVASLIIMVTGAIDDAIDLQWWFRILAQLVAGGAVIAGGVQVAQIGPVFGFGPLALGDFSVIFTLLAVVGLVNALNMIDGVDGLAGSVGFVCLAMLAGAAAYAGNMKLVIGLLLVLSTLAAFLVFNFRLPGGQPARVFLGDAGSGLLGLIIAWSAFRLTQSPTYPVSPILAPFLVAVPVLDCLVLMVRRTAAGKSPFEGDRNHLHHILSDAGYAPHQICAVVAVSSLAFGLVAAALLKAGAPQPLLLIIFCSLLIVHWGVTANRARAVRFYASLRGAPAPRAAVRGR